MTVYARDRVNNFARFANRTINHPATSIPHFEAALLSISMGKSHGKAEHISPLPVTGHNSHQRRNSHAEYR